MLLDDIEQYLKDGGFGANLYLSRIPSNAPAACVMINAYGGKPPLRTSGGVAVERPKIQVVVRDAFRSSADARIEAIKQYLDGASELTINQTRYIWIEALSEPFLIRLDEMGRPEVGCNFEVVKERTAL